MSGESKEGRRGQTVRAASPGAGETHLQRLNQDEVGGGRRGGDKKQKTKKKLECSFHLRSLALDSTPSCLWKGNKGNSPTRSPFECAGERRHSRPLLFLDSFRPPSGRREEKLVEEARLPAGRRHDQERLAELSLAPLSVNTDPVWPGL